MENGKAKTVDMNHFVIKTAGLNIGINALSPSTYGYCLSYLSDEEPDFCIDVTREDVELEKIDRASNMKEANDPYSETIAAYRKIVDKIIDYDVFLMHGAVVATGSIAYMFSASSGTGKTTHIKQWLRNLDEAYVVNGDKPLIKVTEKEIYACGTPWCGKERLGRNVMVPLRGIIQLNRNEKNSIRQVSFSEIYPFLLQQTHIPGDSINARKTLGLLARLYEKVSFWVFDCNNFAEDCFETAYNALIGNNEE